MNTCEHAQRCEEYSKLDMEDVLQSEEKKLEFGLYLRQAGHYWPYVVLLAAARSIFTAKSQ